MSKSVFSKVKLVEIDKLKEHEEIDIKHFKQLIKEIQSDGILKEPITVDKNTNIVLDGHHRLKVLKEIGCKKIPVLFIDYRLPEIKVFSWRKGEKIKKKDVIKAGLSEKKLPPKTSKHMIKIGNKLERVSFLQKRVNISLCILKV